MSLETAEHYGAYQVLQRLSQGGMGDVVLARKTGAHGFEKLFAVKTLRRELASDDRYRRQFNDEARLVSRLLHPNIGQVFDYGEQDGTLYLVMEYVDGVALSKILGSHGALPPRTAVDLAVIVARALHHAHQAVDGDGRPLAVVHRDVSPQNVMLTAQGVPKLIDFGIALMRNRESPETVDGVKGKVGYMSPEQLMGQRLDARTDVFSLGIVLHEMLTGRPLFAGDNVAVTVTAVLNNRIAPPSSIAPGIPGALDEVVLRALARDREQRYHSAEAMAVALASLSGLAGGALESFAAEVVPALRATPVTPPARPRTETATREVSSSDLVDVERNVLAPPRRRSRVVAAVAVPLFAIAVFGLTLALKGVGNAPTSPVENAATPAAQPPPTPPALAPPAEPTSVVATPTPVVATPAPGATSASPRSVPARSKAQPTRRQSRTESAAPAPGEPLPQVFGRVSLVAEPFAQVRVDGIDTGITPLLHHRILAGRHVIEFMDPETGKVRATRVVVVEGEKEALVSVP